MYWPQLLRQQNVQLLLRRISRISDDFTFYDNLFNSISSHGVFIRGADNLTLNANDVSEVTWGGARFERSTSCTHLLDEVVGFETVNSNAKYKDFNKHA